MRILAEMRRYGVDRPTQDSQRFQTEAALLRARRTSRRILPKPQRRPILFRWQRALAIRHAREDHGSKPSLHHRLRSMEAKIRTELSSAALESKLREVSAQFISEDHK
jgi:hypothetical protein